MSQLHRGRAVTFLGAGALLLATTACELPTEAPAVDAVQFAKGGGGPSVEAAIPSEGAQGTVSLQVRVTGSGFDDGSNAVWLRDGAPAPDVTTNSTTYVSRNELLVDITIDAAAVETLYDIEVTTGRGKKGVGVELFSVKKPGEIVTTTDIGSVNGGFVSPSAIRSPDGGAGPLIAGTEDGEVAWAWTESSGIVALPIPPGYQRSHATGLGTEGQIVGYVSDWDGTSSVAYAPAVWASPTAEPLLLPKGSARIAEALDMNVAGTIVGRTFDHADDGEQATTHAVLWTPDGTGSTSMRDLHAEQFAAMGIIHSRAISVNDAGQVVVQAYDGTRERVLLWDAGQATWLEGSLPSDHLVFAMAINNASPVQLVVGSHNASGGDRRAWVWTVSSDGSISAEELIGPDGTESPWPHDLDDDGRVVGSVDNPSAGSSSGKATSATLWTYDDVTGLRVSVELGPGVATGIDDQPGDRGVIRVTGRSRFTTGKGRKGSQSQVGLLWELPVGE